MKNCKRAIKREFHQQKADTFNLMGIDQEHLANPWEERMIYL